MYFPFEQFTRREFAIVARVTGEAEPAVEAIRRAVKEVNGLVALYNVRTGETMLTEQTSRQRFVGALLLAFAIVALSLTLIGVYGVVAQTVVQQTRQFGIRIALGATPRTLICLVLRGGLTFVALGSWPGWARRSASRGSWRR